MKITGFDWDKGNWPKCGKHGLEKSEIESVFDQEIFVQPDRHQPEEDIRYNGVGTGKNGRYVFIVFALRRKDSGVYIRPISARYMHKKEVEKYEQEKRN